MENNWKKIIQERLKNLKRTSKIKRLKKEIKKFIEDLKIHYYSDVINKFKYTDLDDPINTICDLIYEIEQETGKYRVWDWKV